MHQVYLFMSNKMITDNERIRVAVRLCPFTSKEKQKNDVSVVDMIRDRTIIDSIDGGKKRLFEFDDNFMSMDTQDSRYADQETVYKTIGKNIVQQALDRYNTCIFAYGQTGSGKTYTMMGEGEDVGIIPRLCKDLFTRIEFLRYQNPSTTILVRAAYIEIVDDKLTDLLNPVFTRRYPLKIRENIETGVWVQNLKGTPIVNYEQIEELIKQANECCTSDTISELPSHRIFDLTIKQIVNHLEIGLTETIESKIRLVDIASSDVKSLEVLERCLNKLANNEEEENIPYRDSALTLLLKENLTGNCHTVMIATISPSVDHYNETLSTLSIADRVQDILIHPVINEDTDYKFQMPSDLPSRKAKLKDSCSKNEITKTEQVENKNEKMNTNNKEDGKLNVRLTNDFTSMILMVCSIYYIATIPGMIIYCWLFHMVLVFCPKRNFADGYPVDNNNLAKESKSILSLICPWYEVHHWKLNNASWPSSTTSRVIFVDSSGVEI